MRALEKIGRECLINAIRVGKFSVKIDADDSEVEPQQAAAPDMDLPATTET